jgi:hypothetical protein
MSNVQCPMANGRCTSTATGYREMHISVAGPWYKLYMRVVCWDLVSYLALTLTWYLYLYTRRARRTQNAATRTTHHAPPSSCFWCLPNLTDHTLNKHHILGAAFADGFNAETLVILTTGEAGAGPVTVLNGYRCQLSTGRSRIRWSHPFPFHPSPHLSHHHICELVVNSTGIDARL